MLQQERNTAVSWFSGLSHNHHHHHQQQQQYLQQQQQQLGEFTVGREVLAGVPEDVAAVAYDPVALLLLVVSSLRCGAVSTAAVVGSGVLGVGLRALAAEDEGMR
jgi:hypothetical protein